jgi:ribosomal RNA-processing protein 36
LWKVYLFQIWLRTLAGQRCRNFTLVGISKYALQSTERREELFLGIIRVQKPHQLTMSRKTELQRSVRARRDEEDEEDDSISNGSENEGLSGAEGTDESEDSLSCTGESAAHEEVGKLLLFHLSTKIHTMQTDASSGEDERDPSSSLKDVSFGTLAKAQQSFTPPRRPAKRTRPAEADPTPYKSASTEDGRPSKSPKLFHKARPSRPSKHAPQTLSTRHAVPRKRVIFSPPPTLKSRDPRFDPTITTSSSSSNPPLDSDKANQNYSFLTTYRQSELQALQSQVKALQAPLARNQKKGAAAPTNPDQIAALKREIQSLSSKLSTSSAKMREREILRAHKQKEREALREGRKQTPYHLKRREVRKEIERERVEGMGTKAREKREVRRRKREKGKEGRGLPRVRRTTTTTVA